MNIQRQQSGFTFIEVLLVIGLLGLLAALAIPFYQSFQVTSELDNTTHEIISTLREAQSKAMASQGWQAWGVHFANREFILFQGSAYNPADPVNRATAVPGVLSIDAEHKDVIFSAVNGTTSTMGKIGIRATSGRSHYLIINELGVVDEE